MQSPTSASDATALASKDPSPSPAPAPAEAPKDPTPSSPAPAPAEAAPEAAAAPQEPKQATTDPEPSAASSPTKAKSPAAAESADDTKATPSPSGEQDDVASCSVGRGGLHPDHCLMVHQCDALQQWHSSGAACSGQQACHSMAFNANWRQCRRGGREVTAQSQIGTVAGSHAHVNMC